MGYSMDLRRAAVGAYKSGMGTRDELCEMFEIGSATLGRWLRRVRELGSPEPLPRGGGHPRRPGNVVIMDNLSIHKVVGIRQAIENVGARLVFLPPYHPDLNPIEKLWSKLKTIMRGLQARTIGSLERGLSTSLEQITSRDASAWFGSCGY